jgi:hypothetical protein
MSLFLIIIIISMLTPQLLGHRPYLWITVTLALAQLKAGGEIKQTNKQIN